MKLSIIIPVYNEQNTISEIVHRARMSASLMPLTIGSQRRHAGTFESEIVIVDDGSTDATAAILGRIQAEENAVVVRHECNLGKGAAVRTGVGCKNLSEHNSNDFRLLALKWACKTRGEGRGAGGGHQ